jgi:hypothetical protein
MGAIRILLAKDHKIVREGTGEINSHIYVICPPCE